jgi:DNA-binding FrmR family transcriptional regulator
MTILNDQKTRTDLLHRLKRAEGQLRGIQRMIEDGDKCLTIASQMSAVRKALDSAYVRMTVCFIEQELGERWATRPATRPGGPTCWKHGDAARQDPLSSACGAALGRRLRPAAR